MYWSLLQRSWCSPLVSENPLPSCCCHLETPRIPSSWNALHALPETWCFGWNCELLEHAASRFQVQTVAVWASMHGPMMDQMGTNFWWGERWLIASWLALELTSCELQTRFLGAPLRHRTSSHGVSRPGGIPGQAHPHIWVNGKHDIPYAPGLLKQSSKILQSFDAILSLSNVPCRRKHFLQQLWHLLGKPIWNHQAQITRRRLPSGNLTVCCWKWSTSIVDLPIKDDDLPIVCCMFTRPGKSN